MAGDHSPRRIEWRSAAIIGLLLLLGGNGGVVWAEQRVPSGIAALMIGTVPLWMVLMDAIRPAGVRPNGGTMAGVVIGLAGIVLLIGPSMLFGVEQGLDLVGILALSLAAMFWAAGSLYSRNAMLPDSPLLGTSMEMLCGGLGLLLVGTLFGEWGRLNISAIGMSSWLGLLYLIVFGSLVGFVAYTWLLRVAPTPLVATYAYVNPLVAILLGNFLAQETITAHILISALIIIASVVLINISRMKTQKISTTAVSPSLAQD
jgi:drug/metabolite transporter (DMT)-like permease